MFIKAISIFSSFAAMQLAFRKYGEGQPLLILHGLFGQSDNWNTLAKRFGEQGFEVYTIDQRNHGLSPHSDVFTYEAMADDIHEFIETHQLKNPILLGHSMGGKIAMFFALKYDGVLDKLIVADMSPRVYEPHHDAVLDALNAVDFSKINTRKEAEAVLSQYIDDFGTRQFLLKNIYWADNTDSKMDWRFNLSVITKNYRQILVAVPNETSNVNTLFLRGEKSPYITDRDLPEIEKRFPNYKLQTIANAGHWVHAEQPESFFQNVIDFIK
ncbi:MAG TPA: alpha/beta fold hydrolase [Bacteroidia bacterium]|nr:alpha/beta fold hydrolase [Bacteroidia bacterium]